MEDCIILNSYRINHQWNRCVIRVTWIVPPFCCFATCVWFPQIKKTWIHLIWEDWLILIGPETSRKQWWCISHRPKMANRKRSTGRWTKILDHAAIKCSHFNRFFHARGHHIPTGPWPTSSRHPHVLRDEHLQLPSCAVSACHKTSSATCSIFSGRSPRNKGREVNWWFGRLQGRLDPWHHRFHRVVDMYKSVQFRPSVGGHDGNLIGLWRPVQHAGLAPRVLASGWRARPYPQGLAQGWHLGVRLGSWIRQGWKRWYW